jgi:CheY-like chemotaxis protein
MANILVVEDEEISAKIAIQMLAAKGHQVIHAFNGVEALKIVDRQPIDLVITDIIMPEMDGYELIQKLRKLSNPPKIIAMSGGSSHGDKEALLSTAMLFKADRNLPKPFESTSLNEAVTELLGK